MDREPGKYRLLRYTCVTGPCMRPYNVPNDRALAPSAGGVEYKQQVAGSHRYWPLASLQSAQSAAGALVVVRGGQHSRPSALQQRCSRCITQLPHIQDRCRASSDTVPSRAVDAFMSVCHHLPTAKEARQHPQEGAWCMQVRATVMVCGPVWSMPIMYEHNGAAAAFRSIT